MKLFYDLRIGTKLIVSFAIVLALCIVLGVFSIVQLARVNQTSTDMEDNWLPSVRVLLEIKYDLSSFRVLELQHILANGEAAHAEVEKRMDAAGRRLARDRAEYEKLISEPDERALYADFSKQLDAYFTGTGQKLMSLSRGDQDAEATALLNGESTRQYNAVAEISERLAKMNIDGGVAASAEGDALYSSSRNWIVAVLVACVAVGSLQAVWLARIISRPLNNAVELAQTVAAGNLTSDIRITSKDETGLLLQALKHMNDSLRDIVGQVRQGTDVIAAASSQIANGNLDLSARTEEQASSLEETASSMEELTSTVKQNGDNARRANELAGTASTIAVQGGEVVSQVVQTMGSINESANKIVDIIGVIDGIAFQTNILALNAAVEAARAGEQGRGFAVVATEVRNLAQRSAAAAKEIKELINDSVEKVGAGSRLVEQAGKTMDEVVASVQRVTSIMSEIAAAGREQEVGIEQINEAITQMDSVTQQNAALVEEAAAASSSMQEQADKLSRVVSVFRIDGGSPLRQDLSPKRQIALSA